MKFKNKKQIVDYVEGLGYTVTNPGSYEKKGEPVRFEKRLKDYLTIGSYLFVDSNHILDEETHLVARYKGLNVNMYALLSDLPSIDDIECDSILYLKDKYDKMFAKCNELYMRLFDVKKAIDKRGATSVFNNTPTYLEDMLELIDECKYLTETLSSKQERMRALRVAMDKAGIR